jgi:SOS-response transcriptional repressor LexA
MPHALTERQKECLEFIRQYIYQNESSPRLEEIAAHFDVKLPTAHKYLEALQRKGFLYFSRDATSGFFIRLVESAGSVETVAEINIDGRIDHNGELFDFPQRLGHFATVLIGSKHDDLFALVVTEDIPKASMLEQDIIIFDMGRKPKPGDVCIVPIGERLFLANIFSVTFDQDTPDLENALKYPTPEDLSHPEYGQKVNWVPITFDDTNAEFFLDVTEEQRWPVGPIDPELVLATALRLVRFLSF